MTWQHCTRWLGIIFLITAVGLIGFYTLCVTAAENGARVKAVAADESDDAAKISYEIPDTKSGAELFQFIKDLANYRPRDLRDAKEHRVKFVKAARAAAKKIVEVEKDHDSEAHTTAQEILAVERTEALLERIEKADQKDQMGITHEFLDSLQKKKEIVPNDVQTLMSVGQVLEQSENTDAAALLYFEGGKLLANSSDKQIRAFASKLDGIARRLSIVGKSLDITGKTVDGADLDWKTYRGKVVLVDFWATWCGPCVGELPNVKKNYARYHKKGFDVVGISLDEDKMALTEFLESEHIPWQTLFDGQGWETPLANKYGVTGIPCVMLVDKAGKVVSANARGEKLGKLLADLLGLVEEDAEAK